MCPKHTYSGVQALNRKHSFKCVRFSSNHWAYNSMIFTRIRIINREGYWNTRNDTMNISCTCCDVYVCKRTRKIYINLQIIKLDKIYGCK